MSTQPIEGRISRLEGAYEQIADRLNGLDVGIAGLRQEMNQRFSQIDQRFAWVIGLIVTSWVTTILAVLVHHG